VRLFFVFPPVFSNFCRTCGSAKIRPAPQIMIHQIVATHPELRVYSACLFRVSIAIFLDWHFGWLGCCVSQVGISFLSLWLFLALSVSLQCQRSLSLSCYRLIHFLWLSHCIYRAQTLLAPPTLTYTHIHTHTCTLLHTEAIERTVQDARHSIPSAMLERTA